MVSDDARWIRISLIEHHLYCARQAFLVETEPWADNPKTARGAVAHRRVDSGTVDHRGGIRVHHSVRLRHDALRILGVADTVEESADGALTPVEYKSGRRPDDATPARLQVAAQALCLSEMTGRPVPRAFVYYAKDNVRVEVWTEELREPLTRVLDEIRASLRARKPPSWTGHRSRCTQCSIRLSCLPELVAFGIPT